MKTAAGMLEEWLSSASPACCICPATFPATPRPKVLCQCLRREALRTICTALNFSQNPVKSTPPLPSGSKIQLSTPACSVASNLRHMSRISAWDRKLSLSRSSFFQMAYSLG